MYSDEVKITLHDFNIQADLNDPNKVRAEILARLASLHPDKTGGHFLDDEQQNNFQRLLDLLKRFDQESPVGSQMIPIQYVYNLVDVLAKSQGIMVSKLPSKKIEAKEQCKRHIKRKYVLPKITSAILASLCLALISLSSSFRNNPLYLIVVNYHIHEDLREDTWVSAIATKNLFRDRAKIVGRADVFPELKGMFTTFDADGINYLDLCSSTQPTLALKFLQRDASTLNNAIPSLLNKDSHMLVKVLEKSGAFRSTELLHEYYDDHFSEFIEEKLSYENYEMLMRSPSPTVDKEKIEQQVNFAKWYVISLQNDVNRLAYQSKDLEDGLLSVRSALLGKADSLIIRDLIILIAFACFGFILVWSRERSDERWLEYISTDEGLEFAFTRLCSHQQTVSRVPSRFTLSEFESAISTKAVPKFLSLFLGRYLDIKHLGQLSTLLLNKLQDRKIIEQIKSPTLQIWFEIKTRDSENRNECSADRA